MIGIAASSFTPLTSFRLWLDASDGEAGVRRKEGTSEFQLWIDKSGNRNHAMLDAQDPIMDTTTDPTRPFMRFPSIYCALRLSNRLLLRRSNAVTFFAVLWLGVDDQGSVLTSSGMTHGSHLYYSGAFIETIGFSNTLGQRINIPSPFGSERWFLFALRADAANKVRVYNSSTVPFHVSTEIFSLNFVNRLYTLLSVRGRVAELLVHATTMTDTEFETTMTDLMTKWNVPPPL